MQTVEQVLNAVFDGVDKLRIALVGGTVTIQNAEVNVDALTDTELRASAVPVTDAGIGGTGDAANTTGATGSASGKLRGLVTILADAWDDTLNALRIAPQQGSFTDHSSTITAGGSSQEVMTDNVHRRYLFVQNVSSGRLWVNFAGTAAVQGQPSILLEPGDSLVMESSFVVVDDVTIIGATTGQAFTAKEA